MGCCCMEPSLGLADCKPISNYPMPKLIRLEMPRVELLPII